VRKCQELHVLHVVQLNDNTLDRLVAGTSVVTSGEAGAGASHHKCIIYA
jgi:hypothetical protein